MNLFYNTFILILTKAKWGIYMSLDKAKAHLSKYNLEYRILLFETSSATVELAAQAVGCEPQRIAKTLSFQLDSGPILIVLPGDAKINNSKFKAVFGQKATMLGFEEVEEKIGHAVGGVCPFGVKSGVDVYLDESLKRFDIVYPACGTSSSAVKLTIEELEKTSQFKSWVDVSKIPE